MSFQQSAESWRAKLHLSDKKIPVLIGLTALVLVALLGAGKFLFEVVSTEEFVLEQSDSALQQEGAQGVPAEAEQVPLVRVHVGGTVVASGVYEVSQGARVLDAIHAAGGFAEGAASDAINLAREVADGEQIIVPSEAGLAAAAETASSGGEAGGAPGTVAPLGGKVNINQASVAELDTLPGVGASTAQKIIADRDAHGPFKTIEDLKRVSGIGDKKFESLSDLISVG